MDRTVAALVLWASSSIAAFGQCTIEYQPRSCANNFGDSAYQKNNSRDARYRITSEMLKNGSHFRNDINVVAAGDRAYVGCTKDWPSTDYYTFRVVGCERLGAGMEQGGDGK
jgi:hypothetical protein